MLANTNIFEENKISPLNEFGTMNAVKLFSIKCLVVFLFNLLQRKMLLAVWWANARKLTHDILGSQ